MANRKGFKVNSTVVTPDTRDTFPVVDSNDVAGGMMFVQTLADLYAIPYAKRKLSMFVYVEDEGKHYKLIDNKQTTDANCWEEFELVSKAYVDSLNSGGSTTGSGTIDLTAYETIAHAEATYAKKTDIPTPVDLSNYVLKSEYEAAMENLPKVQTFTYEIPANATYPLELSIEIPDNSSIINMNAISEVDD